ncbi:MAG: glycoside hydrolase [Magnetococcus sp. DMHC-6]
MWKRVRLVLLCTLYLAFSPLLVFSHDHHDVSDTASECVKKHPLPHPDCGKALTPLFSDDGRLWVTFSQNDHVYLTTSHDLGHTFTPAVEVNSIPEKIDNNGENRPKVALGHSGEVYISWTTRTSGFYSGNVRFARSLDGGKTFDPPIIVNTDLALVSHRFDTMVVDTKGRIYLIWLDQRERAAALAKGEKYSGAALYYAISEDQGQHFAFNRKVVDHTCECCRLAVVRTESDRVGVFWRHIYPENLRDHAFIWLPSEVNAPVTSPIHVTDDDWQIEGCPHHGPSLALGVKNQLHMAWFSAGKKNQGLFYGRFDSETASLQDQHLIDNATGAMHPSLLAVHEHLYIVWKRIAVKNTQLFLQTSLDNGRHWSASVPIAETTGNSDYPLLVRHKDRVFVSWHSDVEGYRLWPIEDKNAIPQ